MQHDRKEWAPGDSGWAEVGREETGAGQLMGDSRKERGKGEEGTKGAGGNKKEGVIRLQQKVGHGKKK